MKKRQKALDALRSRLPLALECALVSVLFASGLMLPLRGALDLAVGPARLLLTCAGFSLYLGFVYLSPLTAAIGLISGACWFIPYLLRLAPQLPGIEAALALALQGNPLALQLYALPISVLLTAFFCLSAFLLAQRGGGFYPAFALASLVLLAVWFYGARTDVIISLPALAALILLYARSGQHGVTLSRALPTALCAVLLAALLLPATIPTSPAMTETAERVRDNVYDYFFFTDPRSVYSLQLSGYQPLGSDRLGGPARPPADPVLEVATDRTLYLRGTLKNDYTGRAWNDTTAGRRYLFIDPRFRRLRDSLFDAQKPSRALRDASGLFESREIAITLLGGGVSTLFVPQRLASVSTAEGFVPYFGSSSEVFITRDTVAGDAYSVNAALPMAGSAGLAETLAQAEVQSGTDGDAEWNDVYLTYAPFPETVESGVVQLVTQIVQNAATPYERAQLIAGHLRSQYPYTLDQNVPPEVRDFVSWFLLSERQGYCTSFASAMVVMCRIAGLPARYVEGYLAQPDADGLARVTQRNAHAWVEVYFRGFGWLTFDPTPSDRASGSGGSQPPSAEEMPPDEAPLPDAQGGTDAGPLPTPTPDPERPPDAGDAPPTPEPEGDEAPSEHEEGDPATPTPEPTQTPSPPDDEKDDPAEPDSSPTPTPQPSPTPSPTPVPPEDEEPPPDPPRLWLWLIPLLLLAAAVFRLYWTDPAHAAARQKDESARLLCWYRGAEAALWALGLRRGEAESLLAFAQRAEQALGKEIRLSPLVRAICLAQYGNRAVQPDWIRRAERCYGALCRSLSPAQRVRMLARRAVYGLGHVKRV